MINSELDLNPRRIDIVARTLSVFELLQIVERGEMDLHPELQRHAGIWNRKAQSRLIESLMLGLPLQSFYFDVDEKRGRQVWRVIDGLQRMTAIVKFVRGENGSSLRLSDLEYLSKFEGCLFSDLPEATRKTILETHLQVYVLRPGTPIWVKFNIFKRVNTGGLALKTQEIRHVLLNGRGMSFIDALAKEPAFVEATQGRVSARRMQDSEYVNRFMAFFVLDAEESYADMDPFLNDAVRMLDTMGDSALAEIRERFLAAMDFCHKALGEIAFRRFLVRTGKFTPQINKAIFDALSVSVARLTACERRVLLKSGRMKASYRALFKRGGGRSLNDFVSNSTGDRRVVLGRMRLMHDFLQEELEDFR